MAGLRDGAWYLVATCVRCGTLIPYLEVTSDALVGGDGSFAVTMPCPACATTASYLVSAMTKVQARADTPPDITRH